MLTFVLYLILVCLNLVKPTIVHDSLLNSNILETSDDSDICDLTYRPVVIMHGILAVANGMSKLENTIQSVYPGIYIHSVEIGEGTKASVTIPMKKQLNEFYNKINSDKCLQKAGKIDILAHSQGGVIAFGYLMLHSHKANAIKVNNIITMSSPINGFFCDFDKPCLETVIGRDLYEKVKHIIYTPFAQSLVAPVSYWRDPFPDMYTDYIDSTAILPDLLNQRGTDSIKKQRKEAFTKISKWVAVSSDEDEIISPWYSAQFDYFGENDKTRVEMKDTEEYKNDTYGLKTLNERGDLIIINSHLTHTVYTETSGQKWVKENLVIPYLGEKL